MAKTLDLNARAAHKFVSINLRKLAVDVLRLSGDTELNCLTAMTDMAVELSKLRVKPEEVVHATDAQ